MALFAIADTHLSFGTNKPMDTFEGWKNYTEKLEKNWNKLVSDKDTVVIAGDISWAMNFDELKADFQFIDNLNGNKIIIKGNHDYWWNTMSKMNAFIEENNFNSIKILHNNSASLDSAECEEKIVFLHYPPLTTNTTCEEIIALLNEYGISKCCYGHLHGDAAKYAIDGNRENIDFKLISCDRLNFTPYLILK